MGVGCMLNLQTRELLRGCNTNRTGVPTIHVLISTGKHKQTGQVINLESGSKAQ